MNRTVVVVGGAGGIGSAIARRLRAKRYDIVIVDRVKPRRGVFVGRTSLLADLRSGEAADSVGIEIRNRIARVWGLVYAAGIYPLLPIAAYDDDQWRDVMAVNLDSAFRLTRALIPALRPGGRVVFVASAAAHVGSRDIAYTVSKSALLGLTRSLAKSLVSDSILVNAVCPGIIDTAMSRRMNGSARARAIDGCLLRRIGNPDEVAVAVEFLLEPANSYMTGACLAIDGGSTHC